MIANILKFIQSNDMIKIVLILVAMYFIVTYTKNKNESMEGYLVPENLENVYVSKFVYTLLAMSMYLPTYMLTYVYMR